MIIGMPKEVKHNEFRVAMVPSAVMEFKLRGHEVLVEKDAGTKAGFTDKDYADAAASIISRCKNARIYLYQTWSYAPDSPKLISTGLRFETMHRALRDSITAAGAELQVGIAPVGDALYRAVTEYPELQMYISDHYHPAPNLSYLAALVFYKTIYGEGATRHIPETVSAQDAKILQHIGAMK